MTLPQSGVLTSDKHGEYRDPKDPNTVIRFRRVTQRAAEPKPGEFKTSFPASDQVYLPHVPPNYQMSMAEFKEAFPFLFVDDPLADVENE